MSAHIRERKRANLVGDQESVLGVASSEDAGEVEDNAREGRPEELKALRGRFRRLLSDQKFAREWFGVWFNFAASSLAAVLLLGALSLGTSTQAQVWWKGESGWSKVFAALTTIFVFFTLCFVAAWLAERTKLRELSRDVEQVEFRIDLYSHQFDRELKAEKLLRLNDLQLRRYYDMNLSQNRKVFELGIWCIAAGVIIIGVTLYVMHGLRSCQDMTEKIATAVLGGVGAILTNYVAAVYLKMHASANENLASFHERLVETHQLMMGNLLAARIEDDDLRWKTLASLALKLTPAKGDTNVNP
jgi:hypothetical protein